MADFARRKDRLPNPKIGVKIWCHLKIGTTSPIYLIFPIPLIGIGAVDLRPYFRSR